MIDARGIEGVGHRLGVPQEDRTQISNPQVKSLHKCALHCFSAQGLHTTASVQVLIITPKYSIASMSDWSATPNDTFQAS